jgi:hypothetical protein
MDQKQEVTSSQYVGTMKEELIALPQGKLKIMLEEMKKLQNTL